MPELLIGALICAVDGSAGGMNRDRPYVSMLATCDAVLYHAKGNGGNQVFASRPIELRP